MASTRSKIPYINRDFESLKQDLIDFAKTVYGDRYKDFSEASIGLMMLEMAAQVGDQLAFHLDRTYNDLFLDTAGNRAAIMRLAKNLGYQVGGKKPATTLVNLEITVPTTGNTFDSNYAISLAPGIKMQSESGVLFEILEEVDFNSEYSLAGTKNREVIPNRDAGGSIVNYTLRKQVVASAGETITDSLLVTNSIVKPYMTWKLKEPNILSIRTIINSSSSRLPSSENEWISDRTRVWTEVPYLAQSKVFIETSTGSTAVTKNGYWMSVDKRFIRNYDESGYCTLTFGAGILNYDVYARFLASGITTVQIQDILNNSSMGVIPPTGEYLHVRYRIGGGTSSNVAVNSLRKVIAANVSNVPGGVSVNSTTLNNVRSSLICYNVLPAIGGLDEENIDEIRHRAAFHFSAQDRAVTVRDYIDRIYQMPAQFGTIFRAHVENDASNSVTKIYVLTKNESGQLVSSGNTLIKTNLASYLDGYRLLNDVIEIYDGEIINIGVNFTVQCEVEMNKREVIYNCILKLKEFFNLDNMEMNQPIYLAQIVELLRDVRGVVNVAELLITNIYGLGYSNVALSSAFDSNNLTQTNTVPITPYNNTIYSNPRAMFEVKYPSKDIVGRAI